MQKSMRCEYCGCGYVHGNEGTCSHCGAPKPITEEPKPQSQTFGEFINMIQGSYPVGPQGLTGPTGPTGSTGMKGPIGESGFVLAYGSDGCGGGR
jgi:hypothetical protein